MHASTLLRQQSGSSRLAVEMSGSDSGEELILLALLLDEEEAAAKREKKRNRIWVRPILKKRKVDGEYWTLFNELLKYDDKFYQYFRMSQCKFFELLKCIEPWVTKTKYVVPTRTVANRQNILRDNVGWLRFVP